MHQLEGVVQSLEAVQAAAFAGESRTLGHDKVKGRKHHRWRADSDHDGAPRESRVHLLCKIKTCKRRPSFVHSKDEWHPSVLDRKSTRLNSSHEWISYAVFCLKKKNNR